MTPVRGFKHSEIPCSCAMTVGRDRTGMVPYPHVLAVDLAEELTHAF
jgi:hypothetical protein